MFTRLVPHSRRDRLLVVLLIAAVAEIAWAVYLGWSLPRHYVAHHWVLAWVGLDVGEVLMLLACAWAAWRQRALLITFAIAAATMFVLDAWFDVTTAGRGDELQSVLLAVFGEIPAALLLVWVSRRAAKRLLAVHFSSDRATPVRKLLLVEPRDAIAGDASSSDDEI
ncbi:MAG: hypothetical protein WCA31_13715 [Acidimicrobiales bacterium]